ncbi:MAG: biopolymer transporter ExbD [Pseudomonadota bacterium]
MRRRAHAAPELDITAFMNLMVALVPFLLITAVFSHISVLDLSLPQLGASASEIGEQTPLEVILRRTGIEVRMGQGAVQHLARGAKGYNFKGLAQTLAQFKAGHPQKRDVSILAEPDVLYDDIVHAMDSARVVATSRGQVELFPEVTVGEAPSAKEAAK